MNPLFEILIDDVTRCLKLMESARSLWRQGIASAADTEPMTKAAVDARRKEFEYHARQYFRTVFAYIEGITFNLKNRIADFCMREAVELSHGEIDFVRERDYKLTETGKVVEDFAHIKLANNIRLMIALMEKAQKIQPTFDANVAWWSSLKSSTRVRDRLTHPKTVEDLDVTDAEIEDLTKAYTGLMDHLLGYPQLKNS